MQIHKGLLPSGTAVTTAELDGQSDAVVAVFARVGSRHEPADLNGAAHLLGRLLLRGTATRSQAQLQADLDATGGSLIPSVTANQTCLHWSGPHQHVGDAVALLGDMLTHPGLTADGLDAERAAALHELDQHAQDAIGRADDLCRAAAYPDQPLGRPVLGSKHFVQSVRADQLKGFMDAHYFTLNLTVIGAGPLHHPRFAEQVMQAFKATPKGPKYYPGAAPPRYQGGSAQAEGSPALVVAWPTVPLKNPSAVAHRLLGHALAIGADSPLHRALVQDGLVDHVTAESDQQVDYGLLKLHLQGGHDPAAILRVVGERLRGAADAMDPADFARAKQAALAHSESKKEQPLVIARHLARSLFGQGRVITPKEEREHLHRLTMDHVREAAHVLLKSKPSVGRVGSVDEQDDAKRLRAAMLG